MRKNLYPLTASLLLALLSQSVLANSSTQASAQHQPSHKLVNSANLTHANQPVLNSLLPMSQRMKTKNEKQRRHPS